MAKILPKDQLGFVLLRLGYKPFLGLFLVLSLLILSGCDGGNNTVSETPEYLADNWYLKDVITDDELKDQNFESPQTTRDFVNYIQKNGREEEKEALLTAEAEFIHKVLELVQTIRKRKNDSPASDESSTGKE